MSFVLRVCGCLCCVAVVVAVNASPPAQPEVVAVYTLPPIALGALQNAVLPDTLIRDRRIALGSTGSDLWHDVAVRKGVDQPNATDHRREFWMLTDRGPNGHAEVKGQKRRTFPTPDFVPLLIRADVRAASIHVLQVVPVTSRTGQPVTGLPNLPSDEPVYDFSGRHRLPPDPQGIDPEGMVHTSRGDFWIVEEYRPSLLHVDGQGKIVARYIPAGQKLEGADYAVEDSLPAVYGRRSTNRGFEGLAISQDEKTLYILMESPLENPDARTAASSRNGRILTFDTVSKKCQAEFVYRFEAAADFDPRCEQRGLRACAIALFASNRLLVVERTNSVSKVFAIDLRPATNLISTGWHTAGGPASLEAVEDPVAAGIHLPAKRLLVDLSVFPEVPVKIEGISIVDERTIAVSNDNDFAIGEFSRDGNNVGAAATSKIVAIRLPKPLE
jgi:hypothetical protein